MSEWAVPHLEDLNLMKLITQQFDKDTMIPIELWDGDCWQSLFIFMRNDLANGDENLAWEYLAHFIQNTLKQIKEGD